MTLLGIILFTALFSDDPDGAQVGQLAPPLTVDEWVMGAPVESFERGRVYVVELWGTWCSPCIKNIPALSRLQTRYEAAGLVVIGVASHEFKGRDAVASFLKENNTLITYRIAYDGDQSMERDWDTGGREGVVFRMPLSIVIDRQGVVTFVGHPERPEFEASVEKALAEK